MKVNTFGRLALTAGIMAVAASGLVATPAYADPATLYSDNLVGFGSDTTQDVMQELSTAIGADKLASFNSTYTSPATNAVQVRPGGPSTVVRAKGSGDGLKMLQVAEGTLTQSTSVGVLPSGTATANKANSVGQIDYSRSSSAPGTTQSNTGEYVYIPFARDVVGIAVDPSDPVSKIPLTFGSSTDSDETASVNSIFRCKARYVYVKPNGDFAGVGPTETLTAAATTAGGTIAHVITPLVPVFGSGTASFFLKAATGQTDAVSFPAVGSGFECIKRKKLDDTTPIQEHDGSSVAELTNSIGIYSIGQWVAQTKSATTGVTDKTNGTSLVAVDGVAATTGVGAALAPNADPWVSALKRFVYNVVAYRKAADESSKTHAMFVGTDSLVCTNTASISKMGFAPLTGLDNGDPTSNANACGSIAPANRATMGSDGVSMTTAATVTNVAAVNAATTFVGRAFTVSVSGGVATHDMGGTVQILDATYGTSGANVLGTAEIGEGQNITGDVSVTPIRTGTTKLYAYFVPKLGAIKVTSMSPVDGTTDASFASIAPSNPTTTKLSVRKPTTIGGTVRAVAWVGADGAFDGGTVTFYQDSVNGTVLGSETLAAGETAAVFSYTQAVTSRTLVAKFTPTNSSAITSTSAAVTVSLSKVSPTMVLAIPAATAAAPNGFAVATSPFWASAAKRVPVTTAAATVNAQSDVVTTTTAHGLAKGAVVYISGTTQPGGSTAGRMYYVIPASGTTVTGTTFKVSATLNGGAVNFSSAGVAVKVWKQNANPKVTVTITAPAGVSLKPSGNMRVYLGANPADRSTELTTGVTGLTLANGTTTVSLSKADLWAGVTTGNPGTTAPTATRYLIVDYPGDGAFNTVSLNKQIKVTP